LAVARIKAPFLFFFARDLLQTTTMALDIASWPDDHWSEEEEGSVKQALWFEYVLSCMPWNPL
jgi:hypothetical protein